jgi:hypothetical protein
LSNEPEVALPEVALRPEDFIEPRREFRGRIVRIEWGCADPKSPYYNEWVFPPEAPEDIRERQVERQAYAVRVEIMPIDKPWQNIYEWYGISQYKLSKLHYLIQQLVRLKVPYEWEGNTPAERLTNFTKSLLGTEYKWIEHTDLPTIGGRTIKRLLLPVEYYGKYDIETERITI